MIANASEKQYGGCIVGQGLLRYYGRTVADEFSFFTWRYPVAGYHCVDANVVSVFEADFKDNGARVLTDGVPFGRKVEVEEYNPLLMYTGLFRTFALETTPTEDAIVKFANTYGRLGLPTISISASPPGESRSVVCLAEKISDWQKHIEELRDYVDLWDTVQKGDTVRLSRRILWSRGRKSLRFLPRGLSRRKVIDVPISRLQPEQLERVTGDDRSIAALLVLQRFVNTRLEELGANGRLLWDERWRRLALHLVPRDLIGCIWLQFAKAIEGDKQYNLCARCRMWYEVGFNRKARRDKRFCSQSCKSAWHRLQSDRGRRVSRG
jgi:hypothetical protein